MNELNAEQWRDLIRLVSENISDDCFKEIMSIYLHASDSDIFKLNYHQAKRLHEILLPLTHLRRLLLMSAQEITDNETADKVVSRQLDAMAIELVRKADFSLFPG